jgi:hypothetical protein
MTASPATQTTSRSPGSIGAPRTASAVLPASHQETGGSAVRWHSSRSASRHGTGSSLAACRSPLDAGAEVLPCSLQVRSVARVTSPPFLAGALIVHQHAPGDPLERAAGHAGREPHLVLIIGPSPGCHRIHAAESARPGPTDVSADFGRVQVLANVSAGGAVRRRLA